MDRQQMTMDRSYLTAAETMNDAEAGQFLIAALRFGLDGIEPEDLSGVPAVGFALVRPILAKGRARAIAGANGGRTQANRKKSPSKAQANESKPEAKPKQTGSKKPELVMPDMTWASEAVRQAVEDWLTYKASRGDKYTQIGLNKLVGEIQKRNNAHGDMVVVDAINCSIANGWQGIVWDRAIPKGRRYRPGSQQELNATMTERVQAGSGAMGKLEREAIQRMLFEARRDGTAEACEDCGYKPCTEAQEVKCCAACESFGNCSTKCERTVFASG